MRDEINPSDEAELDRCECDICHKVAEIDSMQEKETPGNPEVFSVLVCVDCQKNPAFVDKRIHEIISDALGWDDETNPFVPGCTFCNTKEDVKWYSAGEEDYHCCTACKGSEAEKKYRREAANRQMGY